MNLVEINRCRESIAARIEAEAERDGAAIRRSSMFRIKPLVRRCDSKNRTRPRPAA
jgi:hypothetical protein